MDVQTPHWEFGRTTQVTFKIITMEPQSPQSPPPPVVDINTEIPLTSSSLTDNTETSPDISITKRAPPNQSSLFGKSNTCSGVLNPHSDPHANSISIGSTQSSSGGYRPPPLQQQQSQQDEAQVTGSVSEMKRLLSAAASAATTSPKPVPSFGKPNLAPKPPGNQLTPGGANGSTPTSPLLSSGLHGPVKTTVARHHSMKTPR